MVYFRLQIEKLQYVNKNLLACVQQGQATPIYSNSFFNMRMLFERLDTRIIGFTHFFKL